MTRYFKALAVSTLAAFLAMGAAIGIIMLMQHKQMALEQQDRFADFYRAQMTDVLKQQVENEIRYIRHQIRFEAARPDRLKADVLEHLRHLRFGANDNGYFFVLELQSIDGGPGFAKELLLPIAPELEGQLIDEAQPDSEGFLYRQSYLSQLRQNGEAVINYTYLKPDTQTPEAKISYLYHFKEWNWIIAAGYYLDDLKPVLEAEKRTQEKLFLQQALYALAAISLAVVIFALLYLALYRRIKNQFDDYEATLKSQHQTLLEQARQLNENAQIVAAGEMIKRVAHHWRQPLNAVGILVQDLAEAQKAGELNETYLNQNINKAMAIISRMSKTIDQFRGFLEDDHKGLFDADALVNQSLVLLRPELDEEGIAYAKEGEERTFMVRGSSTLFGRALFHVLINAKEALQKSTRPDKHIRIYLNRIDNALHLRIADNGPGIHPDLLEQVFLPYCGTKGPMEGSGMGLFTAKEIVERRMGGTLTLNTGPEGTTVTFVLPLA